MGIDGNYDRMVWLAEQFVSKCQDDYERDNACMRYVLLFLGGRRYRVAAHPDAEHNVQAVVDAVHSLQRKQSHRDFLPAYYDGLYAMARMAASFRAVSAVLDVIACELKIEKEGVHAFTLDCRSILDRLKQSVEERIEICRKNTDCCDFDSWYEGQLKYLKDHFGI